MKKRIPLTNNDGEVRALSEEDFKKRIYAHLLINDRLSAVEEAEKSLLESVRRIETDIRELLGRRSYEDVLKKMVSIKPAIDAFFDKVMVMAEDERTRANRLALLKYIVRLFFRVLDFSLLQG